MPKHDTTPRRPNPDRRPINTWIPSELDDALRAAAKATDRTIVSLLREGIGLVLARVERTRAALEQDRKNPSRKAHDMSKVVDLVFAIPPAPKEEPAIYRAGNAALAFVNANGIPSPVGRHALVAISSVNEPGEPSESTPTGDALLLPFGELRWSRAGDYALGVVHLDRLCAALRELGEEATAARLERYARVPTLPALVVDARTGTCTFLFLEPTDAGIVPAGLWGPDHTDLVKGRAIARSEEG